MPFKIISIILFTLGFYLSALSQQSLYHSESLKIHRLTKHTLIHESYLETESFGKVSCNGLIYYSGQEAIVFDTPTTNSASMELIAWLEETLHLKVTMVVVTHFHHDCLGGLHAFHEAGAASYGNELTILLAKEHQYTPPQNAFEENWSLTINNRKVINAFLGAGHTRDNIVSYIPEEKVLFGGCLVKALEANEGYTGDATTENWSETVIVVKNTFPKVKYVVPGHGKSGGHELLAYTAQLFQKYAN